MFKMIDRADGKGPQRVALTEDDIKNVDDRRVKAAMQPTREELIEQAKINSPLIKLEARVAELERLIATLSKAK